MVEPANWAEDRLSELDHHGVKGMKWGVRKQDFKIGARGTNSTPFKERSGKEKAYTAGRIATGAGAGIIGKNVAGVGASLTVRALGGSPAAQIGATNVASLLGAYGGYKYGSAVYKNNTKDWSGRGTTKKRG